MGWRGWRGGAICIDKPVERCSVYGHARTPSAAFCLMVEEQGEKRGNHGIPFLRYYLFHFEGKHCSSAAVRFPFFFFLVSTNVRGWCWKTGGPGGH